MLIHSKDISDYIDYLSELGFIITLHGKYITNSLFLKYNYHKNPYCHYVKNVFGQARLCVCHQEKVFSACDNGEFFGCCYAGVGEFVYPVNIKDNLAFFVSVSGYFAENTNEKALHFAAKHNLDKDEIMDLTNQFLKKEIPKKATVDTIVRPLIFMLESYFERKVETADSETVLYHKILRYIGENSHSHITMHELSEKFNYSISTLSHLFSKKSGKSLPAYIDDLRMSEAKWYLTNSNTSITEIALFLGYSSSNYFSTVFKQKFGVTPREYRGKK